MGLLGAVTQETLYLLFIKLKQSNLTELCSLRACINLVNFVRIAKGTGIRPLEKIVLVKFQILTVLGVLNPHSAKSAGVRIIPTELVTR